MQHVLNVPVGVMNNELSEKSIRYNAKDHFDNILLKLYNISIRFNTIWRLQLFSLFVEKFQSSSIITKHNSFLKSQLYLNIV